nr:hypothetical protein [Streptomyces sp. SP2-10]
MPGSPTPRAWPNFTRQARSTVFLDTNTGVLVHRQQTHHLDLGNRTAADILTPISRTSPRVWSGSTSPPATPGTATPTATPTSATPSPAWLNAPIPGWRTDTGRGRDRMAGMRKIRQDFRRATPRSTGARPAARARLTVFSVRGSS